MAIELFASLRIQLVVSVAVLSGLYLASQKKSSGMCAILAAVSLVVSFLLIPTANGLREHSPFSMYRWSILIFNVLAIGTFAWEQMAPRSKCEWSSHQVFEKVGYMYLLLLLAPVFTQFVALPLRERVPALLAMDRNVPLWIQFPIWFLSADFIQYFVHRAMHRFDLTWRFHKVHHAVEQVDLFANFQNSPFEHFGEKFLSAIFLIVVNPSPSTYILISLQHFLKGPFAHINVDLPRLGGKLPLWAYIFTTPNIHAHHHTIEGMRSNYGTGLMIWDWLFGTLQIPLQMPTKFSNGST